MARSKTPSFVTELPLKVSSRQEKELLARLQAARQLYNCCLGETLIRLRQVRNSEPYKQAKNTKEKEQRIVLYQKADKENRFTDYDMKTFATLTANRSKWMSDKLGAHEKQSIGTRAFKAVKRLQLGQAKKVRFKVASRYRSIEGQSNATGIKWRIVEQKRPNKIGKSTDVRNQIKCAKYALVWNGLELEPIIDLFNRVIAHGLNSPVKYCRILWRNLNGKRRWYVQLINEGLPYQKESNYLGEGVIGLDLNISNVAFVGDKKAGLLPFADKVPTYEKEIKAAQRKMQRRRRMANPENYEPDFEKTVGNKVVNKKGKVKKGKRQWVKTRNYHRIQAKCASLERRKSSYAKSQNRNLVNEIIRHGNIIKTENVSVKGWQKRYGKAIAAKSPGFFQSELKRKVEKTGGKFIKFSTKKTALSQTHLDGTRIKKSLSQRVHEDAAGFKMHRDLFSAFLARFVNDDLLSLLDAQREYSGAEPLLVDAWKLYQQTRSKVGASEIKSSHCSSDELSHKSVTSSQIVNKDKKLECMPESQVL
ncbi:MAG: RNA-guided endonuclease TnpB family protein [Cyanobacteria bacterium P01_D01_bin.50]